MVTQPVATGDPDILAAIDREVGAFSGAFGCYAHNLGTGDEVCYAADAVMPAASAVKVVVLLALYGRVLQGELEIDRRVTIRETDVLPGSGVLQQLTPGFQLTLEDLARLMIVVSDNVATAKLLSLIGIERVNHAAREAGLKETRYVLPADPAGGPRAHSLSTPRELSRLMELIAVDGILTPGACAAMRAHLGRQLYLDQIPRFLPFNPYAASAAQEPVRVMNKTGFSVGVRTDTAIIEADGERFVLSTFTERSTDAGYHAEHEGEVLNGSVARHIFDRWAGPRARATARPFVPLSGRA